MNAVPRRYRRLVALGIVSLLVHVLVIDVVARWPSAPAIAKAPRAPLALRLQAAPPPLPALPPVEDGAGPAAPRPQPRSRELAKATPALARPINGPESTPDGASDTVPAEAPGRYRVQAPASATLDYALTRADGTQVPARITWQQDGTTYTVAADGVTGPMSSTGVIGDTGIEPQEWRVRRDDGSEAVGTLTPYGIAIDGRPYKKNAGSQDPASLLLQLAGMGLARPDQLRDVVAVHVATVNGPVVMRFKVTEEEDLATPLGNFNTRHLVQVVPVGQPRLEVWLAPERSWLPVQLRMTAADGTVSIQTVTHIEQADGVPAQL